MSLSPIALANKRLAQSRLAAADWIARFVESM
jgi:hypothetical protein